MSFIWLAACVAHFAFGYQAGRLLIIRKFQAFRRLAINSAYGKEEVLPEPRRAVQVALAAYLAEYGPDGYDKHTFVEFVMTEVERIHGR